MVLRIDPARHVSQADEPDPDSEGGGGPMKRATWPAKARASPPVPVEQGPPQRGGNGAGPAPDVEPVAVGVVPHRHPAGVARQAPGRSRGNVPPVLEHGLAGLVRVRQHRRVDVDHHLVALARRAVPGPATASSGPPTLVACAPARGPA